MAVNLTNNLPPNLVHSLATNASCALDNCFALHRIYVEDLKKHNVVASGLPMNLGEDGYFRHLKKPHGSSKDIKEFLTVSYKGFYALLLGLSIMLEKQQDDKSLEKAKLLDAQLHLRQVYISIFKELKSLGYPIPKTDKSVDKKKLQARLEALIKLFIADEEIRKMIPPFMGEESLLLKWGLVHDYMTCLSTFLGKLGIRIRRKSI